ncbi:UPF0158 family protein [Flavobacterium sp.]|uniref:UPF0158 family protein n=1 Tax=Flavobacterium sp. TaxID=239 RepID=UPI0026018654|nr:UPF0158 family protein [Flavobacterium sp.]
MNKNHITADNIKEIAENLDCGLRAFIHKTSGQLLFVPDEDSFGDIDVDAWGDENEELENNPEDYHEIEKWSSREAFQVMRKFAEQVPDSNLQTRLFDALDKNKPFRAFGYVIDNSEYRQKWFEFQNKSQQEFVASELNRIFSADE